MPRQTILVTGATGLIGRAVVDRLARDGAVDRVHMLTRRPPPQAARDARVGAVGGDFHIDGLGIAPEVRARLASEVTTVIHLAADTEFSQSLADARAINREGTRRLLELCDDWPLLSRWVYVSTAFVAGLRTGSIAEGDTATPIAWANAYEQSKFEAEALVRAMRDDWVIARPATVVCDDTDGGISQLNAVHRALRLYFGGLAPMLPGAPGSTVDVVTTSYVADGIVRCALGADLPRRTFHFCAGAGAMPLDDLLEASHAAFLRAPAWRRKGIVRPARTDLETYRRFEQAALEVGSDRVRQALRSLSHFVPQLAFPKRFDTAAADALLGRAAPPVAEFWTNMVDRLVGNHIKREAA